MITLQGKCQVWSLICAFCIVFFEKTEATQARKEHNGLVGSKGETGQQVQHRGFGQLEKRRGRGGDGNEEEKMTEEEVDHYSNIEMLLRKGTLQQNNSSVRADDKKDKIKNGVGYSAAEPDFDLSLGSWFESLLYSDYDDEPQDISISHEHDDTHSGHFESHEMSHKHHSHSASEPGHGDEDHSEKKNLNPTPSHAASVSMATWLVSFSSITVISLVRSINKLMLVAVTFTSGFMFISRLVWRLWVRCPFYRGDIARPCSPCWWPSPWAPSWGTPSCTSSPTPFTPLTGTRRLSGGVLSPLPLSSYSLCLTR